MCTTSICQTACVCVIVCVFLGLFLFSLFPFFLSFFSVFFSFSLSHALNVSHFFFLSLSLSFPPRPGFPLSRALPPLFSFRLFGGIRRASLNSGVFVRRIFCVCVCVCVCASFQRALPLHSSPARPPQESTACPCVPCVLNYLLPSATE